MDRIGGGERDRTDDLLVAKQALSQLSYTPDKKLGGSGWVRTSYAPPEYIVRVEIIESRLESKD